MHTDQRIEEWLQSSPTRLEVERLTAKGMTQSEIARALNKSRQVINRHVQAIAARRDAQIAERTQ